MTWMKSFISRLFFIVAFVLLACAISEKMADLFGLPGLSRYSPARLLSFAVTALLFVIALELRDIKYLLNAQLGRVKEKEPPVADRKVSTFLTVVSVLFLVGIITLRA